MSEENPSLAATIAAIEAVFGGRWGVWLSDTGWWWAARTQTLTAGELAAGCVPFLHAHNPEELTEQMQPAPTEGHQHRTPPPAHPLATATATALAPARPRPPACPF